MASHHVTALDEIDRWIAPLFTLTVSKRYKRFCAAADTIVKKVDALNSLAPPSGTSAQRWTEVVDNLAYTVLGVSMCCSDAADYDELSEPMKEVADSNNERCMKDVPDAFAAVVKLVPGAKPPGTHANDPVMTPSKK